MIKIYAIVWQACSYLAKFCANTSASVGEVGTSITMH